MFDTPTLLVVDDEGGICRACRRILKQAGFRVHASRDARVGLGRAIAENYSAILLDIKMPEMDGFQFLQELRKEKQDLPVMIMTGYPSIQTAASAVCLGASDYITKPFTPQQITKLVRKMLALETEGGNSPDGSASCSRMSARLPSWNVGVGHAAAEEIGRRQITRPGD